MQLTNRLLLIVIGSIAAVSLFFFLSPKKASNTIEINSNVREIQIEAKQFSFSPNPIRVRLNEKIRFRIISEDVTHGFTLPEFGINETVEPNKETSVEFSASKRGTFSFSCSVACGGGHSQMRGVLIVE